MSTSNSESRGLPPATGLRLLGDVYREGVFVVLALVVALCITEVAFRMFDDFGLMNPTTLAKREKQLGQEIFAGRPWAKIEFDVPTERNADGFHAREFTSQDDAKYRVAVFGDSFVEALQMPIDQTMVSIADDMTSDVQLLAVADSGQYLPVQKMFFEKNFPLLFGSSGKYPAVDAVVFEVRLHGLQHIARGDRKKLGVTLPELPRKYQQKKRIAASIQQPVRRGLRSESHAVSFFATKFDELLRADLAKCLVEPDDARLDWAVGVMRDEVVRPLIQLCEERQLPYVFVYLPTEAETQRGADYAIRERVLKMLADENIQCADATPALVGVTDCYFSADGHPNAKGHELMAEQIQKTVSDVLIPQLQNQKP